MLELLFDNLPLTLLAAGLVLMALEAISPGANFIVIGIALLGAGLVGVLLGPFLGGMALLLTLAGLTLIFGAAATWVYREFDFYGGKGTAQTKDSRSLSGTSGYVTETVTPRGGQVKLEKGGFAPYYTARTETGKIEEGEEIIVLDPGGGNILTVVAVDEIGADEIDRELAREAERARQRQEREGDSAAADSRVDDPEEETEAERSR